MGGGGGARGHQGVLGMQPGVRPATSSPVKSILESSLVSDLDIFLVPSLRLIMRMAASLDTIASGNGKNGVPTAWLKEVAMRRASSRCCRWSSPTGTAAGGRGCKEQGCEQGKGGAVSEWNTG
jgi:hypothetical protein